MRYAGMPMGMWMLFSRSFRQKLVSVTGCDRDEAEHVMKKAKREYKEIIRRLPAFEKADIFKMNIVNCAMLASVLLSLHRKPDVETVTEYYREAMMTGAMKWFCRMGGWKKFTARDIRSMKDTAALRAADRNPYFRQ